VSEGQGPAGLAGSDGPSGGAADAGERGFRDLGLGLILFGSTLALAYSIATDADMHQDFGLDPGPAFLPDILLWLLGIGAVILIIQGTLALMRVRWRLPRNLIDIKRSFVPLLMVISVIGYVALVPALGFLAVSLLFSVIWAVALAVQDYGTTIRPLLISGLGSALIAICIYLAFKQLIGIPLG
jgi:hypothetical protein